MNIFVSYSRESRGALDALATQFEAMGHSVWYDRTSRTSRNRCKWWENILDNIERSDLLLFLLTPQSQRSYQCTLQNRYALKLNKRGLVLMLADAERSLLPRRTQQLPFVDYRHQNLQRNVDLENALDNLPSVQPLPDDQPIRPTPPPTRRDPRYAINQIQAGPKLSHYMQNSLLTKLKKWTDDDALGELAWHFLAALHDRNDLRAKYRNEIEALFGPDKTPYLVIKLGPLDWDYNRIVVALSPDDRYIAAGLLDSSARMWDASTGTELRRFAGHKDCVTSLTFSPDVQHLLVAGGDEAVHLYDVATGQELRQFVGHTYGVFDVAFSPDGLYLVTCTTGGSRDNAARLWDARTGVELRQFPADRNGTFSVTFSPDGHQVLTGNYNVARLWETETGVELHQFHGHENGVTSVAFSSDSRYILTTSYMTVRLWDAVTKQELRQFVDGHTVDDASFSADNQYVLTTGHSGAGLWEIATGQHLRKFAWETDYATSATLSADGKFVLTGSSTGIMRLWHSGIGDYRLPSGNS